MAYVFSIQVFNDGPGHVIFLLGWFFLQKVSPGTHVVVETLDEVLYENLALQWLLLYDSSATTWFSEPFTWF